MAERSIASRLAKVETPTKRDPVAVASKVIRMRDSGIPIACTSWRNCIWLVPPRVCETVGLSGDRTR